MLLSTEETHNGKSSDSVVTRRVSEVQVSQNDAKNLLISSILNLYFCVQRFADLKVNLVFGYGSRIYTCFITTVTWQ